MGASVLWANAADLASILDLVVVTKASMVRFDVSWYFAEPAPGVFDWAPSDRVLDAATRRGLDVLVTIGNSPAWAAVDSGQVTSRPVDPARYAEFVGRVAARYRGRIHRYEIWNEPNTAMFFRPSPDAAVYTQMLRQAYQAIKGVDPDAMVLAGALGHAGVTDGVSASAEFLRLMYANGAKGFLDAVSFHPYDYNAPLARGALYDSSPMQQMVDLHMLMAANGDGEKLIWITEYGAPTNAVSDDQQASLIAESMQQWPEVGYAGPFFVYTMRDAKSASDDPEDQFGVVTDEGRPKKAFGAVQSLLDAGNPARDVHSPFAAAAEPSLGMAVTPVFGIADTWGQQYERGTRYQRPGGFIESPPQVAALARKWQVAPINAFTNGYQDFEVPTGGRVFSRQGTGTHAVAGGILDAWRADLGFPVTDEYVVAANDDPGARAIDFEHGRIRWSPGAGAEVTFF